MHSILKEIIASKHREVEILKKKFQPQAATIQVRDNSTSMKQALMSEGLSFIAEIKRRSPSKGILSAISDPAELLEKYIDGGISAVSVLTDQPYFGGSADDLKRAKSQLSHHKIPVLRKDFIVDEIQITESVEMGADAILLIVSVLGQATEPLLETARKHNIDAIVEVHDEEELRCALSAGAEIIGINNRNLSTFKEDLNISLKLAGLIPDGIIKIAESAIRSVDDIRKVKAAGFDAVLIGEALVTSENPAETLKAMNRVK